VVERAHVVETVGQLDQQHPNVIGRSRAAACAGSRLLGPLVDKVRAAELGQSLDQRADVLPNIWSTRRAWLRVLDRIMQECRRDGRVIELKIVRSRRPRGDGE